ncbi:hypothetical protein ABIA15_001928 [Sinorhizobium fredii]
MSVSQPWPRPTVVVMRSLPLGLSVVSLSCALDALELHQHFVRRPIEHFALFGQNQPARMAMKQLDADILLERTDLAADGGLREMEFVSRMRERAGLRRRMKYAQFVPV